MEFDYLRFGLALVFVLALLGLVAMLLRRLAGGGPNVRRGKHRRLALVEVMPVDAKRRLVLVRRDGVEHLILLGQERDLLVETGIGAAGAAPMPAAPMPTPGQGGFRDEVEAAGAPLPSPDAAGPEPRR
jgi:flagellar protein FliO/FliZ